MASITANLPPLPLLVHGGKTLFPTPQQLLVSPVKGRQSRLSVAVKATEESSESSLSIVKSVQTIWDKPEDRVALVGLGFSAVVAIWASTNIVSAIDKLPIIPGAFELIGILFSSWFIYRYLLYKPDREELFQIINKSVSDIFLGQ